MGVRLASTLHQSMMVVEGRVAKSAYTMLKSAHFLGDTFAMVVVKKKSKKANVKCNEIHM